MMAKTNTDMRKQKWQFRSGVLMVFAGIVFLFDLPEVRGQRVDIVLTNEDKTEIMTQMLVAEIPRYEKESYEFDRLPDGVLKVILAAENLEPQLVPNIENVKFVLLTSAEINQRARFIGARYLRFGKFEVEGSKVNVILINTYKKGGNVRAFIHSKFLEYEFRKVSGTWTSKLVGESSSIT